VAPRQVLIAVVAEIADSFIFPVALGKILIEHGSVVPQISALHGHMHAIWHRMAQGDLNGKHAKHLNTAEK